MKYKALLIFGPPGAGKGTQAKLIAEDKKYFHFSTGDMFRNMDKNSQIGMKVHELISSGNFVPDELTIKLFFETLERYVEQRKYDPEKQILLLDGIPRNPAQVDLIDKKIEVIKIINLFISNNDELIKRLAKRAMHEGRKDDNEEVIKRRLEIYEKETSLVLEKYPKDKILEIEGIGNIEEIYDEIIAKL